ncbi:MAG TPA: hypothetical protein VMZ71_13210 [Gemmataceae bacterium]|nr:hypothetical protein [Gemmataceae bacterium]
MTRCVVALACLVGADCVAGGDDKDNDPVKEKLFTAKVAYDGEMQQSRKLAAEWFGTREAAARKDGDKKLVDQIKAERKAFDESGELPKAAPATIQQTPYRARKALEEAYGQAVKEYVRAKKDAEAAATEAELENFRKRDDARRVSTLLGTWKVSIADYKGEWTFKEDGVVDSSTSVPGKWTLDTLKGRVLITWKSGDQEKFDLPLNPKGTTGSRVGRKNTKLDAVKIK